MNKLRLNENTYQIASTWDELNKKQLLGILKAISQIKIGEEQKAVPRLIYLLVFQPSFSFQYLRKIWQFIRTDRQEWQKLNPLSHWIWEGKEKLSKQLIPSFRVGFKTYYGTGDKLDCLRFIEFITADSIFLEWHKSKDDKHLATLIAILYREKKADYEPNSPQTDGDIREQYNDYTLEKRAKKFQKLPIHFKQAILAYYLGGRDDLISKFKTLFKDSEGKKNPLGWAKVLIDLSQNVTEIDKVAQERVETIFMVLLSKKFDNDNLKEEIKNQKA